MAIQRSATSRLIWYANRLRVMTARELVHRGREHLRARRPAEALGRQSVGALRRRSDAALPALLDAHGDAAQQQYSAALAARAVAGAFEVLGEDWSTADADWSRDPRTGHRWPMQPAHEIDYRHVTGADPKWSWEVNRLTVLIPLVQAADPQATGLARRLLLSWIAQDRTGVGIAWSASIEVAVRAVCITIAADRLRSVGRLTTDEQDRCAAAVADHVRWLKAFPSLHSSANNHRVAELCALLVIDGVWTGALEDHERVDLQRELVDVVDALFAADGVGLEQSPTYAAFTLELVGIAVRTGQPLPASQALRIGRIAARAVRALAVFTDESGAMLPYGDDDEGVVLTTAVPRNEHVGFIASLLGVETPERSEGLFVLAAGGRSVLRRTELEAETTLTVDHGPLGFGAIAAHAHADTLTIALRHAGTDWIVDAGTYRYHGDRRWRSWFRSGAAHNAPVVGGRDSSTPTGDFNWSPRERARGRLIEATVTDATTALLVGHDGYVRTLGASVERRVVRSGEGAYRIEDELPEVEADVRWSFLIPSALEVTSVQGGVDVRDRRTSRRMRLRAAEPATVRLRTPSDDAAWYSPRFGVKEAAWSVEFAARLRPGTRQVFTLVLDRSEEPA